jgi:hypothetical protein
MKALRFILLLPLITAAHEPTRPKFPFQKVVFAIMTSIRIIDITYYWDIERRSLGGLYRDNIGVFQRVEGGATLERRLQNSNIRIREFDGENPRSLSIRVTGRITFNPFPLPDGTLPPSIYRANPYTTVSLFQEHGPIRQHFDIVHVLVTILPPGERKIYDIDPEILSFHAPHMRDILGTFPELPGQPRGPLGKMATGEFAPDPQLQYRIDGNMLQHTLDNTLWQIRDRDITCTATNHLGARLPEKTPPDIVMSFWIEYIANPINSLGWKMFDNPWAIYGVPNTDELEVGPIWDCSAEASTSGTKDEPPFEDEPPHDELRRRKLFLE